MSNIIGNTLKTINNAKFPIVEDEYVHGGFKTFNTLIEMNALSPKLRKPGILVYVLETSKYYKCSNDTTSFSEYGAGLNSEDTYIFNCGEA